MDTKSAGTLGVCIIVAALAVTLLPRGAAAPTHSIHSAEGSLEVDYMIQTSPSEAEGAKMDQVTAIDFLPNYVVVKTRSGHGVVFVRDRIRRLSWSVQEAARK